jgi:hypothetical protein
LAAAHSYIDVYGIAETKGTFALNGGARKLTEVNLKAVWAEFSTLSLAVFA